jgi:hypothetical protein
MTTDDYIEDFLTRVQSTVDQALTELMEVKMIRENDPTEFSFLQNELNKLEEEMEKLIQEQDGNPSHPRLQQAQNKLSEVQEVMVRGI